MDSCEDDVIIACGLYLLSEEEKGENKNRSALRIFSRGEEGMTLSLYIDPIYVLFKNCVVSTCCCKYSITLFAAAFIYI
jgi:hypothetical protein